MNEKMNEKSKIKRIPTLEPLPDADETELTAFMMLLSHAMEASSM